MFDPEHDATDAPRLVGRGWGDHPDAVDDVLRAPASGVVVGEIAARLPVKVVAANYETRGFAKINRLQNKNTTNYKIKKLQNKHTNCKILQTTK